MKNEIKNPMERFISKEETYFYGDGGVSDCDDCCNNETSNPVQPVVSNRFICSKCGNSCPCSFESAEEGVCKNCYVPPKPGHTGMFICSDCGGTFDQDEQHYIDPNTTVCNSCYVKYNRFICTECFRDCPCSYESSIEEVCINCYNALPNCPICRKKVIDHDRFHPDYDYCEACGNSITVTVTPSFATVEEGESVSLTATVSHGQDLPVTWSTEDTNKISVSDDGTVTGLKNGSATVTATIPGGASDVAYINVVPPEMFTCGICKDKHSIDDESDYECVCKDCYNALPECPVCGVKVYAHNRFCDGYDYCKTCGNAITVTVTPSSATVEEGESVSLTATVSHGQDLPVTWSAGGDKVSVSDDGTVTGIGAGSAIVTASIPTGASDSATITVNADPDEDQPVPDPPVPDNTHFICGECNRPCPCRNRAYETDYCYECYSKFPICPECLNTVIPEDRLCEVSDLCKECGEKLTVCIHPANAKVTVGKIVQLVAVISDNYELPVTWSTADTDKILVSSEGIVTAISAGTATVTASIPGGAKATVTVEVEYDNSHVYVDYQKHHTFDCGRAGSGSVRLMDGTLNFTHHDIAMEGKKLPLTISHIYRPAEFGDESFYGTGWMLSVVQTVEETGEYLIYTDASGRKHYFIDNGSGGYSDTTGMGLSYTREDFDEYGRIHHISDGSGNKLLFSGTGRLVETIDSNGNKNTVTYDTFGRVIRIIDGGNHIATFSYDANSKLSKITDDAGRSIEYVYSGNNLTSIIYPSESDSDGSLNSSVSHFCYDRSRLSRVEDVTGINTSIEYYDDGRVRRMTVYGTKIVSDQSVVLSEDHITASDIEFAYGLNTASLTDMIKGTRIVYNLDSEGRELFEYEDSSVLPIEERTAVTLSSVTGYADKLDPNTLKKTTGRLVGASAYITAAASQAKNRLTNSGFSSTSGWTVSENGTGSSGVVTEGFIADKNSYRFISNEPMGENKLIQTITDFSKLDGNVFVASVWAKASGAINNISDDRVQFALKVITYPPSQSKEPTVYEAKFDPSRDGEWQYAAIPIGTTPNYSKIEYVLDYSGNMGTCIFSDPMLIAIDGTERYTLVKTEETNDYVWYTSVFDESKRIIKRVHVTEGTRFRQELYDVNFDLVKVVERNENSTQFITEYKYDERHNLVRTLDKYGNESGYDYDEYGNVTNMYTKSSDGRNLITKTERTYEDGYYLTKESDPRYKHNGERLDALYKYDKAKTLLTEYTDISGQVYSYEYDENTDSLRSLSSVVNGTNAENKFSYTNGYLTNVSHNGFAYRFGYDELGRMAAVSVGNETLFTKSYMIGPSNDADHTFYETGEKEFVITDKRGNPMVKLYNDKNGGQHTVTTTVYDTLGRATCVIDNLRNIRYNYTYNVDGSIASITKHDATTATLISADTYSYDSAKRIASKNYGAVGHTYSTIYESTSEGEIYPDDNVVGVSLEGKFTDITANDSLRRTATRTLTLNNGTQLISDSYAYYTAPVSANVGCTCDYVNSLTTSVCGNIVEALSYTYNKAGNIEIVSKGGTLLAKYYYDEINRLVREDNYDNCETYVWTYDVGGNITSKSTYNLSTDLNLGDFKRGDTYEYNSPRGWKDQLTSFNGQSIIYDAIGNPTTYKGIDLAWTYVRRLASYGANTFEYGADGIRTKKNNITYILDGTKILRESDGGSRNITYYYGTNGVVGFNYNGTDYYYRKNLQGDVIAIYTATGTLVVEYVYDAWGRVISVKDANNNVNTDASFIGNINPFRYRSYYYDSETGLYYLNSRYYDPETGRFINADTTNVLDDTMDDIGGLNLYAYCDNNPVSGRDDDGTMSFWKKLAIATAVVVAVAVVAAVVTVATGGTATAALCAVGSTFLGAAKGAAIGAISGAASGAVAGCVQGGIEGYRESGWDGVLSGMGNGAWTGAIQGAQDGLLSGMVMGGIGGAMNPSLCFVAGTAVLTTLGKKAIETIKVGDVIPCVDHITGEAAEKRVVSTSVNKTDRLVELTIGDETIRCTETHPFQVKGKGWVDASELCVGDLVYGKDWITTPVTSVILLELDEPVEVYNFEVEDCHTYYVGNGCWLVHNASCHLSKEWRSKRSSYWKEQARIGGNDTWYDINAHGNYSRMLKGNAPIGYDNKRVVLHHIEGIAKNIDNFVEIGADAHRAFHNLFGYKGFIDMFVL